MNEDTYTLTMEQIKLIVKNAMAYKEASGFPVDTIVEAVPGLVGFVAYQAGFRVKEHGDDRGSGASSRSD